MSHPFLKKKKKKKRFVTFIDDRSKVCWIYLLKEKSEVENVFKIFYIMVQIQFHEKNQNFRSDNSKEYFNKIFGVFFLKYGTVHQSSRNDTPQYNWIAKRKNKHLLEVARALCFTNNVPKHLWGETILTTTYLINSYHESKLFRKQNIFYLSSSRGE